MLSRVPFTLAIGSALLALPAFAATQEAPPPPPPSASLLQAALGLVAVLAIMFVMAYLARRLLPGQATQGRLLRVVASAPLGTRERAAVIEIGDTWIVVGIAPGNVRTLHTLPRQELLESAPNAPSAKGFAQWLKEARERKREQEN